MTRLIKISTDTLDDKHLFLCPLFEFLFDVEDLVVIFDATALENMKDIDE